MMADSEKHQDERRWLGSAEYTQLIREAYFDHISILPRLISKSGSYAAACRKPRLDTLGHVVKSLVTTIYCMGLLEPIYVHETYMLARSVVERVITCLYLLFCPEEEFQRYVVYAKQKAYRTSERAIRVGDLSVIWRRNPTVSLENNSDLKAAVDAFTSATGKPITRWRSRSLQDMLDYIQTNTKVDVAGLCVSFLLVYDDASEALHGTLYGALFHYEVYQGQLPGTAEKLEEAWRFQYGTILNGICACVSVLVEGIGQVTTIDEFVQEARTSLKSIFALRRA